MADAEIKRLLKQLGEAINETLSDSPKINDCIHSIRDSGYEVFLMIEAKIGFNRDGQERGALAFDCLAARRAGPAANHQ